MCAYGIAASRGQRPGIIPARGKPRSGTDRLGGRRPDDGRESARMNRTAGAQIIDIQIGLSGESVCNKAQGSALMRDEKLVAAEILDRRGQRRSLPVTLKYPYRLSERGDSATAAEMARNRRATLAFKPSHVHWPHRNSASIPGDADTTASPRSNKAIGIRYLPMPISIPARKPLAVLSIPAAMPVSIDWPRRPGQTLGSQENQPLPEKRRDSPGRRRWNGAKRFSGARLQALHAFYATSGVGRILLAKHGR